MPRPRLERTSCVGTTLLEIDVSTLPPDPALRAQFLDALGEAVIATDRRGTVVYWNRAAERLFGWPAEDVLGRDVLELTPTPEARAMAAQIMERLAAGEEWAGEFLLHHRDGTVFPALVTSTAVRDASGEIVGVVGVSRDTSAQHATEAALRESEERRALAARATNDVIWDLDLRTGRLHWNDAARTVFRYPEALGETLDWWKQRVHPVDRPRVLDGLERALHGSGDVWTDEYRFLRGDGSYAAVYDRGYIARYADGRPLRLVSSMVDVTERHRAEEGQRFLAQASMLLDLSLDHEISLRNVARLAATTLADYCLIFLRAETGRVRPMAAAHADPAREADLDALVEHLRAHTDRNATVLARVLRTGRAVLVTEPSEALFGGLEGDPAIRDTVRRLAPRSHIIAPVTARDRVLGAVALASTSLRYTSHELRLAEELGRRAGLAVENARLYEEAILANQAKGDFLAVVSHELRTPLTAILGSAELLHEEGRAPLTGQQQAHVGRIRDSASRLLDLIEGILAFARLESGRESIQPARTSLASLLEDAAAIARPLAEQKGLRFRVAPPAADVDVETDRSKVRHVLLSLLTNAIKFTRDGEVELSGEGHDGEVVFRVRDTGTGIPKEHVSQVFNPFWQSEQADTRRAGGTGLGLSLARRIARMLGGDVRVADTGPGGTTFEYRTPRTPRYP